MPTTDASAEAILMRAEALFFHGRDGIEPGPYLERAGPLTVSLNVGEGGSFDLRIIGWATEGEATRAVSLFRASWSVGKAARVAEYVPGSWEADFLAKQA